MEDVKFTYNEYKIVVKESQWVNSPRDDDRSFNFVFYHNGMLLAQEGEIIPKQEFYNNFSEIQKALAKKLPLGTDIYKISMTIHGCINFYIGKPPCFWNTEQIGFAYSLENSPEDCLISELNKYEDYINGCNHYYIEIIKDGEIVECFSKHYDKNDNFKELIKEICLNLN